MHTIIEKPFYELNIPNYNEIRLEVFNIINSYSSNFKTDVSYIIPQELFYKALLLQLMLTEIQVKNKFNLRYLTVIVNPNDQLHPHVDSTEHPWNFLLPISNTENTRLSFYDCPEPPELVDRINERGEYVPYYAFNQSKCIERYGIELTRPTFINAHQIHGVTNNISGKQRQTISIHICGDFHPTTDIPRRFLLDV